jgi:hypothetical protein
MEGGGEVKQRGDQSSDTEGAFQADSASEARQEFRDSKLEEEQARKDAANPNKPSGFGRVKKVFGLGAVGVLGAFVVAFVLCCGAVMWKREASLTVTGHSWERSIALEAKKKVSKSDWKASVPDVATDVRCKKKKKDTKKIEDGETCKTVRNDNGDGTFSEKESCTPTYREELVYGQHCDFKVVEWTTVRTPKEAGTSLAETPKWPAITTKSGDREARRAETYTVDLVEEDGTKHSCSTNQEVWATFDLGSAWTGSVGMVTGSIRCKDLEPAG